MNQPRPCLIDEQSNLCDAVTYFCDVNVFFLLVYPFLVPTMLSLTPEALQYRWIHLFLVFIVAPAFVSSFRLVFFVHLELIYCWLRLSYISQGTSWLSLFFN